MYRFYLGKIKVPTPGEIDYKIKGANKTVRLANHEEMNLIRSPNLTEIRFKLILPMIGAEKRPDYYLKHIEGLMLSRRPFPFIVNRTDDYHGELFSESLKLVGNMPVTIEDFTVKENAENGPDVEVAITLKRYVHYTTKEVQIEVIPATAQVEEKKQIIQNPFVTRMATPPVPPAKETVSSGGDTVYNITKKYGADKVEVEINRREKRLEGLNKISKDDVYRIKSKDGSGRFHGSSGSTYGTSHGSFNSHSESSGSFDVRKSEKGVKPAQKTTVLGQAMKNLRKTKKYRGSR